MVGEKNGQQGFALIAALLVFWVLTALGMLVFSVSTQDVRVSSRTVGERKGFSAAESAVSGLTQNFNPANPGSSCANAVVVDATSLGDPNTTYSIAPGSGSNCANADNWIPTSGPGEVPISGYGTNWGRQRFLAQVTGTNASYNSNIQVNVGVGYGPVDISTAYH